MISIIPKDVAILLKKLWLNFSNKRRKQLLILIIFTIFSSLTDVITLGMIFPFLAVLTTPEVVFDYPLINQLLKILGVQNNSQLIFATTFLFIIVVLISAFFRITILWANTRLAFASGADLSIKAYKNTLYQPYSIHISRNSSEIISIILIKINSIINWVMLPILTSIGSFFVVSAILATITFVNPFISLTISGCFILLYSLVSIISANKINILGLVLSKQQNIITKSLQEGFGAIKDILLNNSQSIYVSNYKSSDYKLRKAQGNNVIIGTTPRYIIEAFGIILIAILAFYLTKTGTESVLVLQTLGLLAVSAQRLLPLMQQIYHARTYVVSHKKVLFDVINLLDQPLPEYLENTILDFKFEKKIIFDNVSFKYENSITVLKKISFSIEKGTSVGFVGPTGCGKSTILDVLMGLLVPDEGQLKIDETELKPNNIPEWQSKIAHVPQNIYLSDSSIYKNIAFGFDDNDIDFKKIEKVSRAAKIDDFITNLPNGFNTIIGERGAKLSGGQRQRIAIARALYRDAELLVFDEGTSALDSKTEREVIKSIEGFNPFLTIVMVAHRVTTLKNCEKIFEIEKGKLKAVLDYETLNKKS